MYIFKTYSEVQRINARNPSSLSVLISAVADPTVLLEPVTSSSPAESKSLRANFQSSAVVQSVSSLIRSFSPVRGKSGKTRHMSSL